MESQQPKFELLMNGRIVDTIDELEWEEVNAAIDRAIIRFQVSRNCLKIRIDEREDPFIDYDA